MPGKRACGGGRRNSFVSKLFRKFYQKTICRFLWRFMTWIMILGWKHDSDWKITAQLLTQKVWKRAQKNRNTSLSCFSFFEKAECDRFASCVFFSENKATGIGYYYTINPEKFWKILRNSEKYWEMCACAVVTTEKDSRSSVYRNQKTDHCPK